MSSVITFGSVLYFLSYFAVSAAMLFLFQIIYTKTTPYNEVALIKENNLAAAITNVGALIGFSLPIASVIANSVSLADVVIWGSVAAIVQLATFFFVRMFYPKIAERIENGEIAMAVKLFGVSISVGVLNAASMTY